MNPGRAMRIDGFEKARNDGDARLIDSAHNGPPRDREGAFLIPSGTAPTVVNYGDGSVREGALPSVYQRITTAGHQPRMDRQKRVMRKLAFSRRARRRVAKPGSAVTA